MEKLRINKNHVATLSNSKRITSQLSEKAKEFYPQSQSTGKVEPTFHTKIATFPQSSELSYKNSATLLQKYPNKTDATKQTNITFVTTMLSISPNAHNTTQTDDLIPSISSDSTNYSPTTTTNDSPESIHQLFTIDKTPLEPQTQFKESYSPNFQPVNTTPSHLPNSLITPINSIIQSSIHTILPVIKFQPEISNIKLQTTNTEFSTIAQRPTKAKAISYYQ